MAARVLRLILILITSVCAIQASVCSHAFASESSSQLSPETSSDSSVTPSLSIGKLDLLSQSKEWTSSRPASDRIFLKHASKKKFILVNEFASRLSVKEVEAYFLGSFPREAKIQRKREIDVDESVLQNVVADSIAKDGKRIGRVTYTMTFPESAAGFTEYTWAEEGRVWQIVIATLSSKLIPTPESQQSDLDAIFEQITGRNKTASWLQFILPHAEAGETVTSNTKSGVKAAPEAAPTHTGWIPGLRTTTAEKCLAMKIPPEKLGLPPGTKIMNAAFIRACGPGLEEGFDKTVDKAKEMFIAGLKSIKSHAEENLAKNPCVEPVRPETLDIIGIASYSALVEEYGTCVRNAGGRAIVQSTADLAKQMYEGAASLINWIRTTEDRFATVIRMVQEKVDGFDCLNAENQGQVACAFIAKVGTSAAIVLGTAAVTGGVTALASTGSGLSVGARALIALNGAGRSAKAVMMSPVTTTKAVYNGGRSVARGTRNLIARKALAAEVADAELAAAGTTANEMAKAASDHPEPNAAPAAAAEKPAWKIKETPDEFRSRLLHFDPTTDSERMSMLQHVYSKFARHGQVLDVENAILKELNDKEMLREGTGPFKKDRDLVTALTNQHKQILQAKMKEFAAKYAKDLDIKSYSDFKSQRFALIPKNGDWKSMGIPKAVLDDLEKAYREANEEFAKKVADLGIESKVDPKTWFKAGMDASADEANLNARLARKLPNNGGIVRSNSLPVKKMKVDAYKAITEARKKLDRLPSDSPLLDNVEGTRIPKPEIFDIVKKSEGSPEKLKESLRSFYPKAELPDGIAEDLIDYAKKTDTFQPGIWQTSREVASVAEAHHGGITIDVSGMGSNNAYQTALQAAKCVSLLALTGCTRDGERAVTRHFRDQMNLIQEVTLANCKKHGLECFVKISGDDVVVIPTNKPLPRTFARDNLNSINNAIGSGRIRQAEIPPGVASGPHRVELGQHGESIEKLVRNNLSNGTLAPKLKDLTFSVRMGTQVPNMGSVRVLFSGPAAGNLTYPERKALLEAYRKAIDDFNAKSHGREYTFVP